MYLTGVGVTSPQSMQGLSRFQYEAAWRCSIWEDQNIRLGILKKCSVLSFSPLLPFPLSLSHHFSPSLSPHSTLALPGQYRGYHCHLCDCLSAIRDGESGLLTSSLAAARYIHCVREILVQGSQHNGRQSKSSPTAPPTELLRHLS